MGLLRYDAFDVLGVALDASSPMSILDVGANIGHTARRLGELFPGAHVHAFEPVPETFEELSASVADRANITPHALCVGERAGGVSMRVMNDRAYCSVLELTGQSREHYGLGVVPQRRVDVPMVTLDGWAHQHRVAHVRAIKIDVQGLELSVLRGAGTLLRDEVQAVNCEAQLVEQYEGASTFAQIDLELRAQGFVLYQIHELWPLGSEEQHVCLDALWLKAPVLAALRTATQGDASLPRLVTFRRALTRLSAAGKRRVALYGGGRHTASLEHAIRRSPLPIACVIDDRASLHGSRVAGLAVVSQASALGLGIDAVILSSDAHEEALAHAARPLADTGVHVEPLYMRPLQYAPG